jgi:energy-coupling factor transporter ATP-binding protein EcfA2
MRLVRLKVTNFRCFREETAVAIGDITALVGKNDSGKSSLFDALEIFFNGAPESDDLCVHGSDATVRIACVFDDLPADLVIDAQHPTSLDSEYLLNADGQLEIVKVFSCSGSGKVKAANVFARAQHPTTAKYGDLLQLPNAKLIQRAKDLGVDVANVNQTINTDLRRAIWAHADELKCQPADVELKGETAERIWEQLKKYLPVFALFKSDRPSTDQDDEAQDPMKAAIKEAIKTQEAALNAVADQVRNEVQEIADRTVEKIRELDPSLAKQLTPRVTNKNWDTLFSVRLTGDDDIPINKRGSGTRRLVLLSFFRAQAQKEAEGKDTGVIYAVEEPETSQHPKNQKMLLRALEDLASQDGCQVLLTTHTPVLARRLPQESLRFITWPEAHPVVQDGGSDKTLREIAESLGVMPDHSVKAFLGVEGKNDISFLIAISKILHDAGEDVPDLGQMEAEGSVVFVPLGGSCLELWISRLQGFHRPEFYLMDRDTCPPEPPTYQKIADQLAKRENCTAWTTQRRELENYIHSDLIKAEYPNYAGVGLETEDVPKLFAQAVHEASGGGTLWEDVISDPEKLGKKISKAKRRLNAEFVKGMTPALLTQIDPNDEVRGWLRTIGAALRTGELDGQ